MPRINSNAVWEPLDTLREPQNIIRSRTDRSPWAVNGPFSDIDDDSEVGRVHMLEVLGCADRVYVCADASRVG
ncbi:hypothetical protein P9139_04275 [Curtobacterium flaccumfaciens]|nr:hypothetical protein P9139_04275 [Curtobacterium flaccumfaciens]